MVREGKVVVPRDGRLGKVTDSDADAPEKVGAFSGKKDETKPRRTMGDRQSGFMVKKAGGLHDEPGPLVDGIVAAENSGLRREGVVKDVLALIDATDAATGGGIDLHDRRMERRSPVVVCVREGNEVRGRLVSLVGSTKFTQRRRELDQYVHIKLSPGCLCFRQDGSTKVYGLEVLTVA